MAGVFTVFSFFPRGKRIDIIACLVHTATQYFTVFLRTTSSLAEAASKRELPRLPVPEGELGKFRHCQRESAYINITTT